MNNNLYEILEVPYNASIDEIKKSYKKMVIKWHPDKHSQDIHNIKNIEDKFRNINVAYQILSDIHKKKNYDILNDKDKIELFDTFKTYFSTYTSFTKYYNSFINVFYDGNESYLENDFNHFNFNNIYNNIIHKITNNTETLNIEYFLNVSLEDKYNDVYKRIIVPRKTKNNFVADIRILENKIMLEKEGELNGSLIINIICNIPNNINIINNDIFLFKEITLSDYLFGNSFEYTHLDNSVIFISFQSFINNPPITIINNKGLIYLDDDNKRGDLIIYYLIKNINDIQFQNNIKKLYD
jgi:DnaJ family protein B protein 4